MYTVQYHADKIALSQNGYSTDDAPMVRAASAADAAAAAAVAASADRFLGLVNAHGSLGASQLAASLVPCPHNRKVGFVDLFIHLVGKVTTPHEQHLLRRFQ